VKKKPDGGSSIQALGPGAAEEYRSKRRVMEFGFSGAPVLAQPKAREYIPGSTFLFRGYPRKFNPSTMFAEIALPLPMRRTFIYRVAPSLAGLFEPGQRVLVPFQNRTMTGVVVRTLENLLTGSPEVENIREILSLLDDRSLLSGELLELAQWVSDYYFAPLGEVLRACFPPSTQMESSRHIGLTAKGRQILNAGAEVCLSTTADRQFLEFLSEHDAFEIKELKKRKRELWSESRLRRLAGEGLVEYTHPLPDSAPGEKTQLAVALVENWRERVVLSRLTSLQQIVMERLALEPAPVLLARLLEELSLSQATVRSLEKKGLAVISAERVPRDPFKTLGDFVTAGRPIHTQEQKAVLEELDRAVKEEKFSPYLLHGVTGSGKTEIYLALIEQLLSQGKSSLVLMPEIGLTPRAAAEFRARLGERVAILHSALSDGERHDEWWRLQHGEAKVVIGTRSAIFAPVRDLRLVVVDEEHDPSYKQQESPRYHGRDTALMRAKLNQAVVILGSATPAVESFYNARHGKYRLLQMRSRVQERPLPQVRLVDMREDFRQSEKKSVLSHMLQSAIQRQLQEHRQILILLNRRGFSASVLCRSCGQNLPCKYCSIPLSYHKRRDLLLCHYCDFQMRLPKTCPKCDSAHLFLVGEGTEKIELLLGNAFPTARIERLDRDVVQRKNARTEILSRFQKGDIDILVGTQMISKGHDFPRVTLAGILSADIPLSFPDFRSAERTFQLLSQMAGRPGRGEWAGEVMIQTFFPEHYCLKFVEQHDYEGFYEKEIRFRRMMHYPPFAALAVIHVCDKDLDVASATIQKAGKWLEKNLPPGIRLLGPAPAPLARLRAEHRFQILLKSTTRQQLHKLFRQFLAEASQEGVDFRKIQIDIDPANLM
jgi:primosomal protein N' (replication factor Y)